MSQIKNFVNEYVSLTFEKLNHAGEKFINKEFDSCIFKECDFSDASFTSCKFIDCRFIECNLSLVKVSETKFNPVEFLKCKLIGIDWTQAHWSAFNISGALQFRHCILNDSSFSGLHLQEFIAEHCQAHNVDLREGIFPEASFVNTDFLHAMFNQTNLSGADFTSALNFHIDLFQNELGGAKLTRIEALGLLTGVGIEFVD